MTRKLDADEVKAAIFPVVEKTMFVGTETEVAFDRRDLYTELCAAIESLAAAEDGEGAQREVREYAELVRLCRNLLNQEWEQLNLDPIGEFITELDANGFIADVAASGRKE